MIGPYQITIEQFKAFLRSAGIPDIGEDEFLYSCLGDALDGVEDGIGGIEDTIIKRMRVNPIQLFLYIVNEHYFYLNTHVNVDKEALHNDDKYESYLLSVSLDKYFTNEHLNYRSSSLVNRFSPDVSTISLYLNFVLGMLNRYLQNEPSKTLLIDIMQKGFSMAKCIVNLLTEGYETEAFSTWRTLHENECILFCLIKYGKPAMDAYLKHMRFAVAFRGGIDSKEETDKIFLEIKEGMKENGLKSKDMKRFIEYGWLLAVDEVKKMEDFKLNFRDGVERCADLRQYSNVYEMSSEIAHSSPLLIYSRKNYFYLITLLNLYESFFRLEKVFSRIYLSNAPDEEKERYLNLRKLYFSELLISYEKNKQVFASFRKKEKEPQIENKEKE